MKTTLYCPFCGRTFDSAMALKLHVKAHHPVDDYCPICNKKFKKPVVHFQYLAPYDKYHAILYYFYANVHHQKSDIAKHGKELIIKELSVKVDIRKVKE